MCLHNSKSNVYKISLIKSLSIKVFCEVHEDSVFVDKFFIEWKIAETTDGIKMIYCYAIISEG